MAAGCQDGQPGCAAEQAAPQEEEEEEEYPFDCSMFSLAVRTQSPAAQRWFDRGLLQSFNFNHSEAVLCFAAAARLDPLAAMPRWGVAYASGVLVLVAPG